jgi:DNA segregation ATPase FtsK/SpoIIIE-like protein
VANEDQHVSKSEGKAAESAPKKRAHRFVPVDDVPGPGLSPRAREVAALGLCGLALYAMLSLATFRLADPGAAIPTAGMSNLGGAVGYYLALGFTLTLGLAGWVPFVLLLLGSVWLFLGRGCARLTIKVLATVVFAALLAVLFAGSDGQASGGESAPFGAGGNFGKIVSPKLDAAFGGTGRLLLVGFGALLALLIATEWMFSELLARVLVLLDAGWRRLLRREPAAAVAGVGGSRIAAGDDDEIEVGTGRRRRRKAAVDDGEQDGAERDADDKKAGAEKLDAEKSAGRRGGKAARDSGRDADEVDAELADGDESAESSGGGRRRRASARGDEADAADGDEPEDVDGRDARDDEGPRRKGRRAAAANDEAAAPGEADLDGKDAAAKTEDGAAKGKDGPVVEPPVVVVPPPPIVVLKPKPKPKPKPAPKPKKAGQGALPFEDYPFPPIELFQEPQLNDATATSEVLSRGGQAIVNKLANFGIAAEIVGASVGPAVTQYELRLAESIRVNKVAGFESDLAAALRAVSVRVVAPIPGRDTIGIEVPNPERQKVYMRDLLDQFGRSEDLAIPLYLGKDVGGSPIVEDLAKMPHLLIAGTTGSGKSVCINTILLSILMTRTPQQVKLVLVDPKMVELQAYKRVPHLCCDVVTNMKKAPGVLQWAVDEMENRYALLSAAGVNHLKNYNRLGQQELAKRLQREPDPERVQLPYVVIVIDEFADLMNVAQNEVEELIQRLAQKSRAVGMHVILATQRPSSEVITGIIKANLPCQIAFKVNRRIDSRVILDANGAEKLLGFGDMLYMPPGGAALLRAQGTFVADDEMQAVVRFLEDQGQEPMFTPSLVQTQSSSRPSVADRDERYREAVEIILGQQRGSATLLQRALAVGYTRATRLLELMEEDGLVGAFVGSKSRDVLMTLEEYRAREEAREAEADAAGAADGDAIDGDAAEGAEGDGVGVAAEGEAALAAAEVEAVGDDLAEAATERDEVSEADGEASADGGRA